MKYRKKPVVIEAIQWLGSNMIELENFMGYSFLGYEVLSDAAWQVGKSIPYTRVKIKTIDSISYAVHGDYIIKGVQGEFYPYEPDIFEQTYEKV